MSFSMRALHLYFNLLNSVGVMLMYTLYIIVVEGNKDSVPRVRLSSFPTFATFTQALLLENWQNVTETHSFQT